MKATEIQELTNKFIALGSGAEYEECTDSFRAFWRGFDTAVELALSAMKEMVAEHADEIEVDFEKKGEREITTTTYKQAEKRQSQQMMKYIGG